MNRHIRTILTVVTLLIAAILLFARLGHYALWDDEAQTALFAEGVWHTGDTSAVIGKNLVAARGGGALENFKGRYEPPLQHFVAAPFVGLHPGSALAARLPFAIVGFLSIGLIFFWLHHVRASILVYSLTSIALIGNVSMWLYCRQCRYYSFAIFLSMAIAFLYLSPSRKRWTVPLMGAAFTILLASHYMDYAAMCVAFGVDWLIWGRKRFALRWQDWLWLILPQLLIGGLVVSIWNPLGKVVTTTASGGITDKLYLFWWAWRDMNRCEFGALVLIVAAPILWFFRRDDRLLRGPVALILYVLVVTVLTPQKSWVWADNQWHPITSAFDVRYLAAAIPLLIGISLLTILYVVPQKAQWIAMIIGVIAFGTNALNGGSLVAIPEPGETKPPPVQSTLALYVSELIHPPSDPYTQTAAWINAHVSEGESILVFPDYMIYPLMYHAPVAVYAWQLSYPPEPQFKNLPEIHFAGRVAPDYIIAFGPVVREVVANFRPPPGISYPLIDIVDIYWRDLYRPELFWRTFKPIPVDKANGTAIYIFKKQETGALVAPPVAPLPTTKPTSPPAPNSDFHL